MKCLALPENEIRLTLPSALERHEFRHIQAVRQ